MSTVLYTTGESHLVVAADRVALTSDAALAGALWKELSAGRPTADVLDTMLRSGLGSLADLVLLDTALIDAALIGAALIDAPLIDAPLIDAPGSSLRLLVRGPQQVRLELADGTVDVVSAAGVATWVDRVVSVPKAVTVGPGRDLETGLPLGLGVVLAGGFRWSLAAAGGHDTPSPSLTRSAPQVAPVIVPQALGETRAEPAEAAFDHLFESTVMRSVEDAAVRDPADDAAQIDAGPTGVFALPSRPPNNSPGDHDGSTIMKADLDAARPAAPIRRGPIGAGIVARLLLSTGEVIEVLDNSGVVLGRRPQVDRVAGASLPLMVTVPSPNSDISRSHLRLDAVDGRLTATDLRSTNGTVLTEADGTATHLVAGDARTVHPGDVLTVGDGITVTVLEPA